MSKKSSDVRINFEFNRDEYKKVKVMLADLDISMRELMTMLVDDALDQYEKRKKAIYLIDLENNFEIEN